jgi:hypothetical protein
MRALKTRFNELLILDHRQVICAGINWNTHRPWLYPLRSPKAREILREFPPDHGFHNGGFFGHTPVISNDVSFSFWGAPPFRGPDDSLAHNAGSIRCNDYSVLQTSPDDVQVSLHCTWEAPDGRALINEIRSYAFCCADETTYSCRIESQLSAYPEPVTLQVSKFSGLAMRLSHEFTIDHGASVEIGEQAVTADEVHGKPASDLPLTLIDRSGSCRIQFRALHTEGNWFFREYGLLALNTCMTHSRELVCGEEFRTGLELRISD